MVQVAQVPTTIPTTRLAFLRRTLPSATISGTRQRKLAAFLGIALAGFALYSIRGCFGIATLNDSQVKSWFPAGMAADDAFATLQSHGFSASRVQFGNELQVQGSKEIDGFLYYTDFMHVTMHIDDKGRVWQTDTIISRISL
jgi:hypothetical protein